MFLYWNGYEIDGSATSFELILPEQHSFIDFVKDILEMPLFEPVHEYHTAGYLPQDPPIPKEAYLRMICDGDPEIYKKTIFLRLLSPQQLPEPLQREVYALSADRPDMRPLDPPPRNPGASLTLYAGFMELNIIKGSSEPPAPNELDGFIRNQPLLEHPPASMPRVNLTYGPGGYYEYAIYAMRYLLARHPDLATFGGLDCNGGWTHGCTYADSLYNYERYVFPVKHSIKNTLTSLLSEALIQLPILKQKTYWQTEIGDRPATRFTLVTDACHKHKDDPVPLYEGRTWVNKPDPDRNLLTFSEYVELVEQRLTPDAYPRCLSDLATHIALPVPKFLSADPQVAAQLQAILDERNISLTTSAMAFAYRGGYLTFTREDDERRCEVWIKRSMIPYFDALLQAQKCGELEAMKPRIYALRKQMETEC